MRGGERGVLIHEELGGVIPPHHHVLLQLLRLEPVELDRVPQPVPVVLLLEGGGPLPSQLTAVLPIQLLTAFTTFFLEIYSNHQPFCQ